MTTAFRFSRQVLLSLVTASALAAQQPGRAVLQRMHDAYAGKWFSTLRFVQKTTVHRPDGSRTFATWYESLRQTPQGVTQLRIDFGDPTAGNGTLYTADSTWVIRAGKLTAARAGGNEFLPLIEGVYMQPVDQTVRQIESMKVDLSRVTSTTWQGKPTTVIGVSSVSDSTSPQIWVEDERNVVVRALLQFGPSGPPFDVRLDDFVKAGDGWLATKVVMLSGGKPMQVEDYADWQVGVDLPDAMFQPSAWIPRSHWAMRK